VASVVIPGESKAAVAARTANANSAGVRQNSLAKLNLPRPITTPLRVHPVNSRYFADGLGDPVFLTGSHTWDDVQQRSRAPGAPPFDFPDYVRFLQAHGHNCTILWRFELMFQSWLGQDNWITAQTPWTRTGPGFASDGKPRFDLRLFDQSYFDHLRDCVRQLLEANIYAIVELFDGNDLVAARSLTDGCPYTRTNNINDIDDGYTGGISGAGSMTMTSPNAITDVQDALARKLIDTLNDLPNVIWETSEEADAGSLWWNEHMMALIRRYESTKPFQHPVGFGMLTGGTDAQLYSSSADWIAPHGFPIAADNQGKVVFCDSDHMGGPGMGPPPGDRSFVWKALCLGSQTLMMDPYRAYSAENACPNPTGDLCAGVPPTLAVWDPMRDQLGYARAYAAKSRDLASMTPQPQISTTGYALVNLVVDGAEYIVYAPGGGSFSVDLSGTLGTLRGEWFNPGAAQTIAIDSAVPGGSAAAFAAPFSGDALLYLTAQ
jgi:hypothetical protein